MIRRALLCRARQWLLTATLSVVLFPSLALGGLHLWVEHRIHAPLPALAEAPGSTANDHWYFAYGSNMPTRYLANVRGVLPAESLAGALVDHAVVFYGPGPNALEPAFAYLVQAQGQTAHGVLHRISAEGLARIKASEGDTYSWTLAGVRAANGLVVPAHTLVRTQSGAAAPPSRRYLNLLREGAAEHGLPSPAVQALQMQDSVYVPLASEAMGSLLMARVMWRAEQR